MFTGIVEHISEIISVQPRGEIYVITIDLAHIAKGAKLGDSIAINGCCLTITTLNNTIATFDATPETINNTTLKQARKKTPVNIERAMLATSRFDGHIVQGHIDGVGKLISRTQNGASATLLFSAPKDICDLSVKKGSITIDGISLTIVDVTSTSFSIAVIPHTLAITTLAKLQVNDSVNIETDILGRYVQKFTASANPSNPLSLDHLRQHGFA